MSNYYFYKEGVKTANEFVIIPELMALNILFVSEYKIIPTDHTGPVRKNNLETTLGLFVFCANIINAAEDSECLLLSDLLPLYENIQEHGITTGIALWICRKRKKKPLPSIIENLKLLNLWSADFDEYS